MLYKGASMNEECVDLNSDKMFIEIKIGNATLIREFEDINDKKLYYANQCIEDGDKSQGLAIIEELANNGYAPAQDRLAGIYLLENKNDRNYIQKALKLYHLSASQGDEDAIYHLGILYTTDEFIEKDLYKAEYWLLKSAEKDRAGMYQLGRLYFSKESPMYDKEKGLKYLEEAASWEDEDAMVFLGGLYYYGEEVKQDYQKAAHYLDIPAYCWGNNAAQLMLGTIYYYGLGMKKDEKMALLAFQEAANDGVEIAKEYVKKIKKTRAKKFFWYCILLFIFLKFLFLF